jgi:hypothetical protein
MPFMHMLPDPGMNYTFNRPLLDGTSPARLKELSAIAPRIKDYDTWHTVWLEVARKAEAEKRWADAASYYHGAEFYLPAGDARNALYDDFARNWARSMQDVAGYERGIHRRAVGISRPSKPRHPSLRWHRRSPCGVPWQRRHYNEDATRDVRLPRRLRFLRRGILCVPAASDRPRLHRDRTLSLLLAHRIAGVSRGPSVDGGALEPSFALKLFIEAQAAICVPSTEKCSSDSNPPGPHRAARACRSSTDRLPSRRQSTLRLLLQFRRNMAGRGSKKPSSAARVKTSIGPSRSISALTGTRANTTFTVKLTAQTYKNDASSACDYAALVPSRCS